MALPFRLLSRLGGGRRGRVPPPLAVLAHLSAASSPYPTHQLPSSTSAQLSSPPRSFPFSVPTRSFSWYSRSSPSSPAPAAPEDFHDEARTESTNVYLDDASTADYGEGPERVADAAAGAADAALEVAVTGDGGGVWNSATETLVDLIDGFHSLTGLPWWITISLSTVTMRLLILPALVLQMKKLAKIGEAFPKLPPPLPPRKSGRSYRDQYSLFQEKRRELGCPSFLWNFAYFSVQFPCFILWMSSIRSMCLSNHPEFDNGGILWFDNLTEYPHGALGPIFPILVAGLHYLNVQISFQTRQIKDLPGIHGLIAKYYKIYLDILVIPLFLIGYVIPQGSLVYWTTNSLFTVAQQLSLNNDVVRKMLGLPDIRANIGHRAQKSPFEGHKMTQRWSFGDSRMQAKMASSDNGTSSENTTPNFMFESSVIKKENVSESSPEELLEQAIQYLVTGRRDQAIPLIRTAIEEKPDLSTGLIGMGQTMYSNRLFPEATVCFEHGLPKLEEHDPLLVLAHFGAGLSRKMQGDNEMAIQLLQRLAELKEPEQSVNKTCYFLGVATLGSMLYNEGRKSEAAKYLRLAVAYEPTLERLLKECEDAVEDQPKSTEDQPKSAEH